MGLLSIQNMATARVACVVVWNCSRKSHNTVAAGFIELIRIVFEKTNGNP